jgi:hypothetical protein
MNFIGHECVVQFFFSFSSVLREVWIRTQRFINLASHLSLIDLNFLMAKNMIEEGKIFALDFFKNKASNMITENTN